MPDPESDPCHHTQKMKRYETVTHLREDIEKVDNPKVRAMFEPLPEF